jgi:hypothetical protein
MEEEGAKLLPSSSSSEHLSPQTYANITNRHAQPTSKLHAYQHETPRKPTYTRTLKQRKQTKKHHTEPETEPETQTENPNSHTEKKFPDSY